MSANATTWNADSGISTACSAPASGATGCDQFNILSTSGNLTAKVRAYSTATSDHSQGGNWITGDLALYSGNGFGITNRVSGDTNEGITPEHAIDNNQAYDMAVVELPQLTGQTWDINSFLLGWAREGVDPNTDPHSADVQVWFGGANLGANYNFANACFTGCTNSGTGTSAKGDLAYLGFTDVSAAISSAANSGVGCAANTGGSDVCELGLASIVGNQAPGNYLIVSGRLGDSLDAFKLKQFDATASTTTKVPLPGTLALMGLGLAGLGATRRRKGSAA